MNRLTALLIGPELYWLIVYFAMAALAKANVPPSKSLDGIIENLYLWIPLLAIVSFAIWYLPGAERNWLLVRLWIAGIIGGHLALSKGLAGYSDQGPGIGTAWMVGVGLLIPALIGGTILVKLIK